MACLPFMPFMTQMFTAVCAVMTACIAGCCGTKRKEKEPLPVVEENKNTTRMRILFGLFIATILTQSQPRKAA